MTQELIKTEPKSQATIFEMAPDRMIHFASQIAKELVDVIDKQKLYVNVQGKKHVRIEGWSTLGAFLGIFPREKIVKKYKGGAYEAVVELINARTGQIVGQASALCSPKEPRWGKADDYARRSMAITRATGKAYRLGFSWIMTMAGYEGTPAEEIPHVDKEELKREAKEGYDPHNKMMQDWLIKQLTQRNIPSDRWDDVGAALAGKSSSQLDSVITTVIGAH